MQGPVDYLREVFAGISDGRGSPGLIGGLKVRCYETQMPLEQLGPILIRDNDLLVQPYDVSLIPAIVSAIEGSPLNLTAVSAKTTVLVKVPAMSGERREALAKYAKGVAEQQKVIIRNLRRDMRKAPDADLAKIEADTKHFLSLIDAALVAKIERLRF